ncbi:MAG: peptide deformylase [Rikenellaceae bacterium]|jgi:peptide deformylase|nr:peptide deformylase [Rikenellaceae bacterium]
MVYPILIYGSPSLRKESEPVTPDYPELKQLIADMFETMRASEGVGLAAPQIGRNIRLIVADASIYADEHPELADFQRVFINPEIVETSDEEIRLSEGCLSVPGIHEELYRPEKIVIKYFDENFEPHEEALDGFPARIAQHEADHLEGHFFTDRLQPLRRALLSGKLSSMAKGNYKAAYKTRQAK